MDDLLMRDRDGALVPSSPDTPTMSRLIVLALKAGLVALDEGCPVIFRVMDVEVVVHGDSDPGRVAEDIFLMRTNRELFQ